MRYKKVVILIISLIIIIIIGLSINHIVGNQKIKNQPEEVEAIYLIKDEKVSL